MRKRTAAFVVGITAPLLALAATAPATAHNGHHHAVTVTPVVTGLTANKPLDVTSTGTVLFTDQQADGTAKLKAYQSRGWGKGKSFTLGTLPAAPSEVASAGFGRVWVLFGGASPDGPPTTGPAAELDLWTPWSGLHKVADLAAYAQAHPDPADLEDNPGDSNPYGLAALGDGSVLVADAAANAVRRVWPSGRIRNVANLPTEVVSTAGAGNPNLPPEMPAEAVATSVAVGPDGYYYVGELKGYPFPLGESRIWRIKPGTQNATCDPNASKRAACSLFADGFTGIVDLSFDARGSLYVLEIAKDGVLAVEDADPNAPPPPSALIKLDCGRRTEIAAGQIFIGGAVDVDKRSGAVFVTDFQLVPSQGRILQIGR